MPRLKVSLTDEEHQLLQHVANATGQTMSGVLQDLFATAAPTLKRVAEIAIAARRAPQEFHEGMVASLEAAEARLAPLVAQAAIALDEAAAAAERPRKTAREGAGGSRAAGVARAGGRGQPPLSNTGVRSPKSTRKAPPRRP